MKNYKFALGLLIICTAAHIHGSEMYISQSGSESSGRSSSRSHMMPLEGSAFLNKDAQKEFRETLADYRGTYTLQQLLLATGDKEVKAEKRLRLKQEKILNKYATERSNDPYVTKKLKRLEKFKNEEIPNRFKQLAEKKAIELKTEGL